jgi:hypothetical protein
VRPERLPEPTGLSKALGLVGRGVDLLDHRGLLDRFAERAPVGGPVFSHFALEQGVTLDAGDKQVRALYVVGCDGGSSVIRKLAGIGFPGLPPSRILRLGDFTVPEGVARER